MSRVVLLSLLLLPLCLLASGTGAASSALAADAPATCQQRCVAEQRECVGSGACTTGTAGEQKECKRVCEQTYAFCVEACG